MKNKLYIFFILLASILTAGCDNYMDDTPIITAIKLLSQSESKFAQPAEQQIIDAVLQKQTVEGLSGCRRGSRIWSQRG